MIEIKNLSYVYQKGLPSERKALTDINLKIGNGEIIAVIGHTGSGKSTLSELMGGLLQPSSGQVLIDGEDIKNLKRTEICKKVGLVFQYPENQLFEETVYADIAFGPKNMGFDEAEIKRRVLSAADAVGLNETELNKSPFDLSGGQKRRAAIAGVLAMQPQTLILDEPAAGLDPRGQSAVFGMIRGIHRSRPEMTVIFVSHSMEDVAETAERVIVMNDGKIEVNGAVSEVFSQRDMLTKTGLDVPPIMRIADKLRLRGYDIPKNVYTIKSVAAAIKSLGERNV